MKTEDAKKIKLQEASDGELRFIITLQLSKLGVDGNTIPDNWKMILLQWLKRYYGWLTLFQFDDAFNMAFRGKLDCDAANYGKFTVEYCGRILSAYERYIKASGEVMPVFDSQRRFQEIQCNKENLKPMPELIAQMHQLLKEKSKIKKHGTREDLPEGN